MKKVWLCAIAMLVVLMAAAVVAQETTGPKIEIKEIRRDFGPVVQGTSVTHVFEVRNAGTEELIIEKVQSS